MTKFVTYLKAQIHLLYDGIQHLAADRPLLEIARDLESFATQFPDDPTAFYWLIFSPLNSRPLSGGFLSLKRQFKALRKKQFSVLHVQWKLGLFHHYHHETLSSYMALFETLSSQTDRLYKEVDEFVTTQSRLRLDEVNYSDEVISPQQLVTSLIPTLQYILLGSRGAIALISNTMRSIIPPVPREKRRVSVWPSVLPDSPPVRYHPFYTIQAFLMIAHIIFSDTFNIEQMWVTLQFEDTELLISISSPNIDMRPAVWNYFYERFTWPNHNVRERLREFGSDLEPLTWDKGYGQGVTMRLPWA